MIETTAEALSRARRSLGLPEETEGAAHRVRRLDGGETYFIVELPGRVICLGADGTVLSSAETSGTPVPLSAEAARDRAGFGPETGAELVWRSSRASRSMLDPVWAISRGTTTVYVDQRGIVWNTLAAHGRGG